MTENGRADGGRATPSPILYLALSSAFFVAYIAVAGNAGFFQAPDFYYAATPLYIFTIPSEQVASMLWKILLLFPATFFFAVFLTLKGKSWRLEKYVSKKYLPMIISLAALLLLLLTVHFVFHKTQVTDDELAYDLQARLLLAGKLYVTPPVPGSFGNIFVLDGPKLTGKYTIGHPLVLAAGMLAGSPYVFPLLLSALLIPLVYWISLLLYKDRRTAVVSSVLLAVSPFFYFTASTRLSHSTSAFFLVLFMSLFLKLERDELPRLKTCLLALAAGLAAGFAFNVRPLSALGFLFPFLIMAVLELRRRLKPSLLRYVLMGVGFLTLASLTLWYNRQVTGHFFEFPFFAYNRLERLFSVISNPSQLIMNLATNTAKMNSILLGFPLSLLFVVLLVFQTPKDRGDRICFAVAGSFCLLYLSYYSPGVSDTGPVYYYELLVPLIILSARGILGLHGFLQTHFPRLKLFTQNFVVLSILASFVIVVPERAAHLIGLTAAVREPYDVIEKAGIHNALVFVKTWPMQGYVYGPRNNNPGFSDDILFARLLKGEANLLAAHRFPGRKTYILNYNHAREKTEVREVTVGELTATKSP